MSKKNVASTMSEEELDIILGKVKSSTITSSSIEPYVRADDGEKRKTPDPTVESTHEEVGVLTIPIAPEIQSAPTVPDSPSAISAPTPPDPLRRPSTKQRKASFDEYKETFLRAPKISDRQPVFLSRETRDRLDEIVRKLGDRKMSVSGFLENLARQHFEAYAEDIEVWKRL